MGNYLARSAEKNDNEKVCGHVQNVQFANVRKIKPKNYLAHFCCVCLRDESLDGSSQSVSLWLCLICGSQLCEQHIEGHALRNWVKLREIHALAMDNGTFTVRCFSCNVLIDPQKDTTLNEIVEFFKHQAGEASATTFPPETANEQESMVDASWSHMRGMLNPGHKYPLNAFLQCMARSSFFMLMVKQTLAPGVMEIPGGEVKLADEVKIQLPAIKIKTPRIVDTTLENMLDTLNELTCGDTSIVSPVKLDEFPEIYMNLYEYFMRKLKAVLDYPRNCILKEIQTVLPDRLFNQQDNLEAIISEYQQQIVHYNSLEMCKFGQIQSELSDYKNLKRLSKRMVYSYSIALIEHEERKEKATIYSYLKAHLREQWTVPIDGVGDSRLRRNRFLVPPLILALTFSKLYLDDFEALSFPFVLNLTPFCNPSIKTRPGKMPILYELFGIIEQKGAANRYAAYVKVRTPPSTQDTVKRVMMVNNLRLRYFKIGSSHNAHIGEHNAPEPEIVDEPELVDVQPSPGKWYYAQDTYVREVMEEEVLSVRPLTLFYERIIDLPDY